MSLYADIRDRDIPYDSHESDLYIPVTGETRALLAKHSITTATVFRSSRDERPWFDVPFAYEPWWDARRGRRVTDVQS